MNTRQPDSASLPVRCDLTLAYASSLVILMIMATASLAGLLYPATVYPARDLLRSLRANDVANLVVGVPALLASVWLTRRGVLIGLLLWPGALLYVLYNYLVPLFCMPLNAAFLLYLGLVTLSVYTIIDLIAGIDAPVVQRRLSGAVPERATGAILSGAGVLFLARATGVMVTALLKPTPVGAAEVAVCVTDFLITPAWIIGGALLWRRKPLGYATGLGLLFQASMLFVGLMVFMVLQPYTTGTRLALGDLLVVAVMGLIFFIPFGVFLRGAAKNGRPSSAGL